MHKARQGSAIPSPASFLMSSKLILLGNTVVWGLWPCRKKFSWGVTAVPRDKCTNSAPVQSVWTYPSFVVKLRRQGFCDMSTTTPCTAFFTAALVHFFFFEPLSPKVRSQTTKFKRPRTLSVWLIPFHSRFSRSKRLKLGVMPNLSRHPDSCTFHCLSLNSFESFLFLDCPCQVGGRHGQGKLYGTLWSIQTGIKPSTWNIAAV